VDANLYGGDGNDSLVGGTGNDWLLGEAGIDTLVGGAGNDEYYVGDAGDTAIDTIVENANEGQDTLVLMSALNVTLAANVEDLKIVVSHIQNSATANAFGGFNAIGNDLNNRIYGTNGANQFTGGLGNDTLTGYGGADLLDGGEGNDSLNAGADNLADTVLGGAGNDTLVGTGLDSLNGGAGDDTYILSATDLGAVTVTEAANGGTDLVQSARASTTLWANVENLVVTGGAALAIGNDLANSITGNTGADTLDGGLGADTLVGRDGADLYRVDNALDVVTENDGEGIDTVESTLAAYTLTANVEHLVIKATVASNGAGNDLNNQLTGNNLANTLSGGGATGSGNDSLYGLDGNDTLYGQDGNDLLDGGAGTDSLIGGTGDDIYIVDASTDVIVEQNGLFDGLDTVIAKASYTLGNHLENLTLQEGSAALTGTGNDADNTLQGNALANTLTGGAGMDVLQGGAGADTLIGGADDDTLDGQQGADSLRGGTGDDTYFVDVAGDSVTELVDEGYDIVYSTVDFTLGANIEELWLQGSAVNGTGNNEANGLVGTAGANVLSGLNGDDVLIGLQGNDSLNGGAGHDALTGSEGNDTLNGGLGNDTYWYFAGDGQDLITDSDATTGNQDVLSISGAQTDQLVIQNWYLGNQNHIESIQTLDSSMSLDHTKVNALVTAMAQFGPAPSSTTLPANIQTALAPVIAANWQPSA
jgi:Ca2+-binding RTX toxin-like protein